MAMRLNDLERRARQRSLRALSAGAAPQLRAAPARPQSRPFAEPRMRPPQPRTRSAGNGLEARLIAAGAPPAEAARLAAEIAAIPQQMSRPQGLGLRLPTASEAAGAARTAIMTTLRYTALGGALNGIFMLCDRLNIAIAIGLGGIGGAGAGAGLSGGIVFGPGNRIGVYGSVGAVLGEIFDLAAGVQLTVIHGGLDAFNGTSVTIGGIVGEGLGLSAHLVLNTAGDAIGFIAEIGLTGGLPINIIGGIWETRSWTTAMAYRPRPRAHGANGGLEARLIAAGAPPEDAARLAAEINAIPRSMARAQGATITMPSASEIGGRMKEAVLEALSYTPIGLGLDAIFSLCDRLNIAIGIGIGGIAGVVEGIGVSGGIVFAPGRRIGIFGSAGFVVGEIANASAGAQLTVVHGGLSAFNGTSMTMGAIVGQGLGLSAHLIMNNSGPVGFIAEISLTGGLPVNAIGGIWETRSWTTAMAYAPAA